MDEDRCHRRHFKRRTPARPRRGPPKFGSAVASGAGGTDLSSSPSSGRSAPPNFVWPPPDFGPCFRRPPSTLNGTSPGLAPQAYTGPIRDLCGERRSIGGRDGDGDPLGCGAGMSLKATHGMGDRMGSDPWAAATPWVAAILSVAAISLAAAHLGRSQPCARATNFNGHRIGADPPPRRPASAPASRWLARLRPGPPMSGRLRWRPGAWSRPLRSPTSAGCQAAVAPRRLARATALGRLEHVKVADLAPDSFERCAYGSLWSRASFFKGGVVTSGDTARGKL